MLMRLNQLQQPIEPVSKKWKETIDEFENDNTSINDDNVHEYIESFKDILINSDDVEIKEYIKSKVTSITVGKEEVKFEIA